MNTLQKISYGLVGFATAASVIIAPLAMAKNGHANNGNGNHGESDSTTQSMTHSMNVMVNIGNNGNVEVHGATVTAISGNTVSATTGWGSAVLTWTVTGATSTPVTDREDHKGDAKHKGVQVSDIKVGDKIDFNGTLNTTATGLSVTARTIRDRSAVVTPAVNTKDVFEGSLVSLGSTTTLPTSIVIHVGSTNYTVNMPVATMLLKSNFTATPLSTFQVGDTVRVFGVLNASSSIDALVVRDATR